MIFWIVLLFQSCFVEPPAGRTSSEAKKAETTQRSTSPQTRDTGVPPIDYLHQEALILVECLESRVVDELSAYDLLVAHTGLI